MTLPWLDNRGLGTVCIHQVLACTSNRLAFINGHHRRVMLDGRLRVNGPLLTGFRIVWPIKSWRCDQMASPGWCPWLDLANKRSPGLVRIRPRLVSPFSPSTDRRQGMCINKQVSLHVASLDYELKEFIMHSIPSQNAWLHEIVLE